MPQMLEYDDIRWITAKKYYMSSFKTNHIQEIAA